MPLTPAQRTTLKTDVTSAANAVALGAFITAEDWPSVATFYNQNSVASVWRPNVSARELTGGIVGSAYDSLSVAKQNGYIAVTQGGVIDTTQATIRAWFSDIFGAGATLTNLTAIAQRLGTRFEILFSSVAGTANVTTMFGQLVSGADIQDAMLHG